MIKLHNIRLNIFPDHEEFIDKLSYQFSVILLLILIIVVGIIEIIGPTIQCFTPQEFTTAWDEFSKRYCYSLGKYFPTSNSPDYIRNKTTVISNHQTISSMLFMQALLIFISYLLWRLLISISNLNLQRIMETAKKSDHCLQQKKTHSSSLIYRLSYGGFCAGKSGIYLSIVHIIIKVFYLFNVVVQLWLMKRFIGTNYLFYGFQVFYDAVKNAKLTNSANFPVRILCEMEIPQKGRINIYSLYCVLSINIFLEKIFIFLWFWFFIIGCLSIINLIKWLKKLINKKYRVQCIKEYLKLTEPVQVADRSSEDRFIFDYLKKDGFLIINLISINISDVVAADFVCNLWDLYRNRNSNEYEQLQTLKEDKLV